MPNETEITVYTREDCHLCEDVISTIREVSASVPTSVSIDLVDVDGDSALRERYGERVPYVLVDGSPKFKYRVDASELRALLVDA